MIPPCRILLAAGLGRRFGGNKRLAWHQGKAFLRWAAETLLAGPPGPAVCVLPPDAAAERDLLADLPWTMIANPDPAAGQGASLACAVRAARARGWGEAGWLVGLVDLPELKPATVETVLAAAAAAPDLVHIPRYQGQPGHPVYLPPGLTEPLTALQGDIGARQLWQGRPEGRRFLEVEDPGCCRDRDQA